MPSSASRPVMNLTIALDLESTLDFTVGSVTTPTVAHQQVVPDRRRRLLILGICSMSLLIVGLDATIVTVALPAIQRSFHSTLSGLQWTIDAYTLVLASLLMLSGSTADRLGRRRVFQAGLVLFSLGSLLCALAPSLGLLVAFRVLQAIGGSMLSPVAMSIVRNVFEDPRERARAIGVFAAMFGISMALGPVLGGFLVSAISWRGLSMLPPAMMMVVFAPLSGRLVGRLGARPSMLAGGLAVLAGGLMLTGLAPATSVPFLLSAYAVFGFGFALVSPPIANTAVSGMPPAQAGVAAAVATTSRQVGITLGVAVLGAVAGGGLGGGIGRGSAQATRPGWWIVAALGLAVAALGYLTTTAWARDTARRTAQRLDEQHLRDLDPRERAVGAPSRAISARQAPNPCLGE